MKSTSIHRSIIAVGFHRGLTYSFCPSVVTIQKSFYARSTYDFIQFYHLVDFEKLVSIIFTFLAYVKGKTYVYPLFSNVLFCLYWQQYIYIK